MTNAETHIDFTAPARLMKFPSLNGQRISAKDGARPYTIVADTLDSCIAVFQTKPASQYHLYEIHTQPQGSVVTGVLSDMHIAELVRLREFL